MRRGGYEDGEGAEKDDEDVGDEGDEARVAVGAVVVHQAPAYQHHRRLPLLRPTLHRRPRPPPPITLPRRQVDDEGNFFNVHRGVCGGPHNTGHIICILKFKIMAKFF